MYHASCYKQFNSLKFIIFVAYSDCYLVVRSKGKTKSLHPVHLEGMLDVVFQYSV